ncbi:hypothetical protein ACF3DV_14510 [Chlorogloeopsis fritschii PCC 9212]|uniref:hypothetical protein n=1 Tax=Chlorogloeopsis fritschii TaxID=1124 RepID=UPI00030C3493|nr:hypothetical protein [Chlorogloeopsis fritschii]
MKFKNQALKTLILCGWCATPVATTRLTRKGALAPLRETNSYFESATPIRSYNLGKLVLNSTKSDRVCCHKNSLTRAASIFSNPLDQKPKA